MANSRWTPDSWRTKPVEQSPVYKDQARACGGRAPARAAIRRSCSRARRASSSARSAAPRRAQAFLLQGGDCAESFGEHSADNIRDFFRVFLQMAVVMTFAAGSPIVKVGRVAGQFAKPRSSDFETIDGVSLPAIAATSSTTSSSRAEAREPDPRRQLEAYRQSAATLNLLRAFATGGYANLENAHRWMLGFVKDSPQSERYQGVADRISETLGFMRAIGLDAEAHPELRATDFYTSHEALLLGYEQALTRLDSTSGDYYATSGHMIWIGDRTRQLGGAHVEYCRGVKNPIGLKCGPSITTDDLLRLIEALDPESEPGRLTLICRFGADKDRGRAAAAPARGPARGAPASLGHRPDARQYDQDLDRLQDPADRAYRLGSPQLLRDLRGRRRLRRRRPSRNDRQERHRMHRRRAGHFGGGSAQPLPHLLRSAAQRRAVDRARLH